MNAQRRKTPEGESVAKERLIASAVDLFYREGIHAVGVDRIIGEAGVTRATFYRHFPGKEQLVLAYLDAEDATIKGAFSEASRQDDDPERLLALVIDTIAADVARHHTRGCPFINAAAEYPDPGSPVRAAITSHRTWFRGALVELLTAHGAADPDAAAGQLVLLRDAAMVGGYLDGWDRVEDAYRAAAAAAAGLTQNNVVPADSRSSR